MKCDDEKTYTHMVLRLGLCTHASRYPNTIDVNTPEQDASVGVQLGSERKFSGRGRRSDIVACTSADEARQVASQFLRTEVDGGPSNRTVAIMEPLGWTSNDASQHTQVQVNPAPEGLLAGTGSRYDWIVSEINRPEAPARPAQELSVLSVHEFRNASNVDIAVTESRGPLLCHTEEEALALAEKLQLNQPRRLYVVSKIKARSVVPSASQAQCHHTGASVAADNGCDYRFFVVKMLTGRNNLPQVNVGVSMGLSGCIKTLKLVSESDRVSEGDVRMTTSLASASAESLRLSKTPPEEYKQVPLAYVYGRITWVQTDALQEPPVLDREVVHIKRLPTERGSGAPCEYLIQGLYAQLRPGHPGGVATMSTKSTASAGSFNHLDAKVEMPRPVVASTWMAAKREAQRLKRLLPNESTVVISKVKAHVPAAIGAPSGDSVVSSSSKKRKLELVPTKIEL
jgi:hypothetical protein